MADTPDIWSRGWPEPPARASSSALTPVRPIGGRTPRFGVAHELDVGGSPRAAAGSPAARVWPVVPVPSPVPREGMWSHLRSWWACREVRPVDVWHRTRCHFGRHQVEGGRQIQLGGRFVNTERCCVWCGHRPW